MTIEIKYPRWLLIQIGLALLSLLIISIVALGIGPLLEKKAELETLVAKAENEKKELNNQIVQLSASIKSSREAVYYVSIAIDNYHAGNYSSAIENYNRALKSDSMNAYIYNLKGYSEYKAKRLFDAENTLRQAVVVDPKYAWGYFDLARILCKNNKLEEALFAIRAAQDLSPELRVVMSNDGEFMNLCGSLMKKNK